MRRRPAKARRRRRDGPSVDGAAHDRGTEDLREFADRMSEAERIVGFGVWRWELASGRVRWSDELHRIYGLAPGAFAGTVEAFLSYLHPGDRERVWALVGRALETGEAFAFEERIVRADGRERVLLSQGRVVLGSDGGPEALVGSASRTSAGATS